MIPRPRCARVKCPVDILVLAPWMFILISMFTVVPCACGIIILVYLVKILQNKGLILLSVISYEIYIIHGYFIRLITHNGSVLNLLIFILAVSAGSVLLHFTVLFLTKKLVKKSA